jgi:acetyltransferase
VVLADSGLEMIDAARALDRQPVPRGHRVGIVTNSGGTGVELTDLLAEQGLTVPELSAPLRARLAESLPAFGSPRNPVDVTTAWKLFGDLYPLAVDALARSAEVDIVVPVLLQRSASGPVVDGLLEVAAGLAADGIEVPIYACWVAPASARPEAERLQAGGIPCFEWPARAARAAALAARYGAARETVSAPPPAPEPAAERPSVGPGVLEPEAAAALLRAYGVEVAEQRLAADPDAAATTAAAIGFPVVAKLVSTEFTHKSDVGGVRVGLADAEQVRAAAAELLAIDPSGEVLLQPLVAGIEVIVGGFRDPQFGPVVAVGLGGVLVEVLHDVAFRLAPLSEAEALTALQGLRGRAVLEGVRGAAGADLDALARTVAAVARLMAVESRVAELDLNPVLASPRGAVAVDVRVVGATEVAEATPA